MSAEDYIDLNCFLEETVYNELRRQEQDIIAQELHAQEMYDRERAEVDALADSLNIVVCPVCSEAATP